METNSHSSDDIEIRNDEINEVLKKPPNWLMKFGIPIIFSFFGLVVLIGFTIKVPTYVRGNCEIKRVYPDRAVLKTNETGTFHGLLGERKYVTAGDTIGFVRNNGVDQFLISPHTGEIEELYDKDTFLVNQGMQLFAVTLGDLSPYQVSMQIGLGDHSLVRSDQNIEIHINGVPMDKYGFFIAPIDHINPMVDDSQTILISGIIETESVSNKGFRLPNFENNLMGSARIKTNESSLLFKTIFENFIKTKSD